VLSDAEKQISAPAIQPTNRRSAKAPRSRDLALAQPLLVVQFVELVQTLWQGGHFQAEQMMEVCIDLMVGSQDSRGAAPRSPSCELTNEIDRHSAGDARDQRRTDRRFEPGLPERDPRLLYQVRQFGSRNTMETRDPGYQTVEIR